MIRMWVIWVVFLGVLLGVGSVFGTWAQSLVSYYINLEKIRSQQLTFLKQKYSPEHIKNTVAAERELPKFGIWRVSFEGLQADMMVYISEQKVIAIDRFNDAGILAIRELIDEDTIRVRTSFYPNGSKYSSAFYDETGDLARRVYNEKLPFIPRYRGY